LGHLVENFKPYQMSSFSENAAERLAKKFAVQWVEFNRHQNSRIYPQGMRIESSNYNPQPFWNCGAQMVALNFQTHDIPMQLNASKFSMNGNCGYILKPTALRQDKPFDPNSKGLYENVVPFKLKCTIISGQHLHVGKKSKPLVEVQVFGVPQDQMEFRTSACENTVLPRWNESFDAKVTMPELAMIRFAVMDGKVTVGQSILPLAHIRQGE
jgi:hypothetical protein